MLPYELVLVILDKIDDYEDFLNFAAAFTSKITAQKLWDKKISKLYAKFFENFVATENNFLHPHISTDPKGYRYSHIIKNGEIVKTNLGRWIKHSTENFVTFKTFRETIVIATFVGETVISSWLLCTGYDDVMCGLNQYHNVQHFVLNFSTFGNLEEFNEMLYVLHRSAPNIQTLNLNNCIIKLEKNTDNNKNEDFFPNLIHSLKRFKKLSHLYFNIDFGTVFYRCIGDEKIKNISLLHDYFCTNECKLKTLEMKYEYLSISIDQYFSNEEFFEKLYGNIVKFTEKCKIPILLFESFPQEYSESTLRPLIKIYKYMGFNCFDGVSVYEKLK